MMTREEFEKVVRAMRAEGVPLSMPNLMLRTELPRHTIEDWLEAIDAPPRADDTAPRKTAAGKGVDAVGSLRDNFGAIKDRVVREAATRVVKDRLGIDHDRTSRSRDQKARRDLRLAAALGLLAGPFGLFYAAPFLTAALASALYAVIVAVLLFVPLVGMAILAYALPVVHLACCALSAAYAWRFNRVGSRSPLLPS